MEQVTWSELKNAYSVAPSSFDLRYVELDNRYLIWFDNHGLLLQCTMFKDDDNLQDFENNYKPSANIPRAERVRITTCQIGRRTNYRYITFKTADDQNFDNTDYLERDFGDVTYTMKDSNGDVTTVNAEAIETHISFLPSYDYEISGGVIDIPSDLQGDLDKWELHVVAAPQITEQNGGCFPFFANNRLKFNRGMRVGMDEGINPAEMNGSASSLAREIAIIIKHPAGVQHEFQVMYKIYRGA